jgi:hypothetical protein
VTTTFAASLALCGIDRAEAAAYLEQPIERIGAWCLDASGVPLEIWHKLGWLYSEVITNSDMATDTINQFGLPPNWQNDFSMERSGGDFPAGTATASGAMALLGHFMMLSPAPQRPAAMFDWGIDRID